LRPLRTDHPHLFDPNPLVHPNTSTDGYSLLDMKPARHPSQPA
jgi:hypothetical protein